MPMTPKTTAAGIGCNAFVLGGDGCRAGWVAVRVNLCDHQASGFIAERFSELIAEKCAMLIVDMPIGLATEGRRDCERQARRKLSPGRTSSVFSSPRRPMLEFASYQDANAWGKAQQPKGGGLSKQAWMIAPKIREIDAAISPADQARIGEGHPEVAFARLKGAPCAHPKRTAQGANERLDLLMRAGVSNAEEIYQSLRAQAGARAIGRDDVYDACVLALTARARLDGTAWRLGDGARDARGLVMEIWA